MNFAKKINLLAVTTMLFSFIAYAFATISFGDLWIIKGVEYLSLDYENEKSTDIKLKIQSDGLKIAKNLRDRVVQSRKYPSHLEKKAFVGYEKDKKRFLDLIEKFVQLIEFRFSSCGTVNCHFEFVLECRKSIEAINNAVSAKKKKVLGLNYCDLVLSFEKNLHKKKGKKIVF